MIEKKTSRQIYNIEEGLAEIPGVKAAENYFKFSEKEWISKDSFLKLLEVDNLCYITKERLLKEIEK